MSGKAPPSFGPLEEPLGEPAPAHTPVRTLSRCSNSSMSEGYSGSAQLSRANSHMSHDGAASGDSTTCASPAEVMDMSGFASSALAASQRKSSFTDPGISALLPHSDGPTEPLKISLRLHDSTGKSISVNFDFDVVHDCVTAVAADMASYLALDAATVPQIARRIEANVAKEKAKMAQAAVMAHAGAIASTLCVAAAQACRTTGSSRRSTDLAAEQHAALIERHRRRMQGLLAEQRRQAQQVLPAAAMALTAMGAPPPGAGSRLRPPADMRQAEPERQHVRFCKFRGMYVPAVIKQTCLALQL